MKLFKILPLLLCFVSCGQEHHDVNEIMDHYKIHMDKVGHSLVTNDIATASVAIDAFSQYLKSPDYIRYIDNQEADYRARWTTINKKLYILSEAIKQAGRTGDNSTIKPAYKDVRDKCISCHRVMREGNRLSLFEEEVVKLP